MRLPEHLRDCLRVNWYITKWCNYSCQYCPVMLFHTRSKDGQPQQHAFDHYPVEKWLELFDSFPQCNILLRITGGEPFLDRSNFRRLLSGLLAKKHIRTGVSTNAYWDPAYFAGLDKETLFLDIGFHPSQTDFPSFFRRLLALRQAGFDIAVVNYVLAPENLDLFDEAYRLLDAEGFYVQVSPMFPTGVYMSRVRRTRRELELLVEHNPPVDLEYKLLPPAAKGRLCFYPAMTYYLLWDGSIQVSCMDSFQNAFRDGVPPLPREAVSCPLDQCIGCTDMYRAIVDEPLYRRPLKMFSHEDLAREIVEYRRSEAPRLPERMAAIVQDLETRLAARRGQTEAALPVLPLNPAPAPFPAQPVFGWIDLPAGCSRIEARTRDRIALAGWAASARHGAPLREIRLHVAGRPVAVVREFHPRPDVAAYFNRPDMLQCGWQGMFYLPQLAEGLHELTIEAVDPEGNSASLPSWPVHIVA